MPGSGRRRETLETRSSALMLLEQGYSRLLGKMENFGLMDVPLQRREREREMGVRIKTQ